MQGTEWVIDNIAWNDDLLTLCLWGGGHDMHDAGQVNIDMVLHLVS